MMKKLISLIAIILLLLPAANAYIYTEEVDGSLQVPVGGNMFLTATLENATKLNQEGVSDANFTTGNHTFPYQAAYKITYKNSKGQTDYLITWKCDNGPYLDDYVFDDYYRFYSGYLSDNKTPITMETDGDYVYGIILDTKNITYDEADLVHDILGKYNYALSNGSSLPSAPSAPIYYESHYNGPVIDPYETARNDPYAYYDYFDYEDNVDIDEYLYDQGYDE